MGIGPEPSWMFDFGGTVLPIFLAVLIGILALSAGRGFLQWSRNNKSPVLTVSARIVGKRTEVTQRLQEDPQESRTVTAYYVTFELEDGARKEFRVGGGEYGVCAEGDSGQLTYQGTRYRGFQRQRLVSVSAER